MTDLVTHVADVLAWMDGSDWTQGCVSSFSGPSFFDAESEPACVWIDPREVESVDSDGCVRHSREQTQLDDESDVREPDEYGGLEPPSVVYIGQWKLRRDPGAVPGTKVRDTGPDDILEWDESRYRDGD